MFCGTLLCTVLVVAGCGGGKNGEDASDDGQEDTGSDVEEDVGPCIPDGEMGEACERDCECIEGLECLGWPGETECAVPCSSGNDCVDVGMGCVEPACDHNVGACRCPCLNETDCPGEVCHDGWCVGCALDEHCALHECDSTPGRDTPVCRPDTETCECGGECGDGVCDPVEVVLLTCPEDCAGTCTEGVLLSFSCWNGRLVPWCECVGSEWVCEEDPAIQCAGATECLQRGGQCVADAGACTDGVVDPEPMGCSTNPVCCMPETCTPIGGSYDLGMGICCPGLVALSGITLVPSEGPATGVTCMLGCVLLFCSPCGDGVCEVHFNENYCNCPEDCPPPPGELVCLSEDYECGAAYCRQSGSSCYEETPRCVDGSCELDTAEHPGWVCNCETHSCEAP